jgi:phage terminase small subunit
MASDLKTIPEKRLTGKQAAFVRAYCGEANFVSNVAARMAGYDAKGKHSFESIGSELLTKPNVKEAIDEHFKAANVSASEVLVELGRLARGNSKDKIKALALLSQHHGLLNGEYWSREGKNQVEIIVKYETDKRMQELTNDVQKDVDEYNRKALASNADKDRQFNLIKKRYQQSTEAIEALDLMFKVMKGYERVDEQPAPAPEPQPTEVEIIPPERRLQPAAIERMMESFEPEIVQPEPQPQTELCQHGKLRDDCSYCAELPNAIVVNPDGTKTYNFGRAARRINCA